VGRFIAFNTADLQAISDINFNVTKLAAATADFVGENDLSDTVRRLESNGTEKLEGNKIFHAADYMVGGQPHPTALERQRNGLAEEWNPIDLS
jgi:hypothetical protein